MQKKEECNMQYQIKGDTLPVVICQLEAGETMVAERGSMSWMSPNMAMNTTTNGGIRSSAGTADCGGFRISCSDGSKLSDGYTDGART